MSALTQNLTAILGALGPIFFLIALGYMLRRSAFPGEAFWPAAERLTYFLLFPALLVRRLALADLDDYAVAPLAAAHDALGVSVLRRHPWALLPEQSHMILNSKPPPHRVMIQALGLPCMEYAQKLRILKYRADRGSIRQGRGLGGALRAGGA